MFGTAAELDIIRKIEGLAPVDDFFISLPAVFGAERGPSNQAFEHDGTQAPPVTAEGVALPNEDFRRDVIGCTDRRVSHNTTRFAPHVDLRAVADGKINLVERHGVAVATLRGPFEELLVVGVFMLSVEASAQAKVGELNVPSSVKENVVGFDVAVLLSMKALVKGYWYCKATGQPVTYEAEERVISAHENLNNDEVDQEDKSVYLGVIFEEIDSDGDDWNVSGDKCNRYCKSLKQKSANLVRRNFLAY